MTKIDVVSGFLGAGKTTLIKKLIKEALAGEQVVLIENEFGEIGIDGGFLKDAGIEIKEMNSGCICCSLVGDFGSSLKEVLDKYHPERIIIEPSGVGKLSDVVKAIEKAELTDVVLNSAVAVVDAGKCKMYVKNFGEFFVNQVEHAGTVILSRTDNISDEKLKTAVEILRGYNETATIITTPWDQLDGKDIEATIEGKVDIAKELMAEVHEHHHHEHDEECTCGCHDHDHHHHHADEVFTSWGLETPDKYSKADIENILEELEDEKKYGMVLRAKGMVPNSDGAGWIYFDYVPGEASVREGAAQPTGAFCVIGSKLNEDNLKALFAK